MRWLLAMKAYFGMNDHIYKDDKMVILVFLNKMRNGRGGTFTKGWYMKLVDLSILDSKKTFKVLCDTFEETFIPKDLKDQAQQTIYSFTMDQFNGNFDQYATAFKLTQAHSSIDINGVIVQGLDLIFSPHFSSVTC